MNSLYTNVDPACKNPHCFGNWQLDASANALVYPNGYDVPLNHVKSESDAARWLMHVSQKQWCSPDDLAALAEAFSALANDKAVAA